MPPFLSLLSGVDLKRVGCIGLGTGVFVLLMFVRLQGIELKKIREVYSHPTQVVKIVTRRVEGPVRIRTRIIEVPGGARETTIDEERGIVLVNSGANASSAPAPLASTMTPYRTDRYLLRVGSKLDAPGNLSNNFKFGLGYSIKNRVDLVAEMHHATIQGLTENSVWADVTLRL